MIKITTLWVITRMSEKFILAYSANKKHVYKSMGRYGNNLFVYLE